jgi:hypothetical protein
MRRLLTTLFLGAFILPAAPMLVGCDDTVEHEKKVDVKNDGTVVKDEKKVTESPNGTVTKTEEKKVDKP